MLINENKNTTVKNNSKRQRLHGIHLDWMGQMIASILWAASVFAYNINSLGDLLQLCAAIAWMVANIATLMETKSK